MSERARQASSKLQEALRSKKFMVTISYIDNDKMIQNYLVTSEFPRKEIPAAWDRLTSMVKAETIEVVESKHFGNVQPGTPIGTPIKPDIKARILPMDPPQDPEPDRKEPSE